MPLKTPDTASRHGRFSGAPPAPGVYVLWEEGEPIFIGATRGDASIRSRLQDHYARRAEPHDASHFSWEITAEPVWREAELLVEFRMANARLPRCNATR